MSSTPSGYLRIKALFQAVCDLPDAAAQRSALHALGADEATVEQVMQLLRRDRRPESLLDLIGRRRRGRRP